MAPNPGVGVRYVIATLTGDQPAACIPGTGRGYFIEVKSECVNRPVFAALNAQQLIGVVRAKLIGGVLPDKPSIGVVLDIHDPAELLRLLAPEDQPF